MALPLLYTAMCVDVSPGPAGPTTGTAAYAYVMFEITDPDTDMLDRADSPLRNNRFVLRVPAANASDFTPGTSYTSSVDVTP